MTALGPVDRSRRLAADQALPLARLAARDAGVTRLADVTRLDRFGLPVWQAVRPMSRALSVHQGKGATDVEAQVGALMEAIESHFAETFDVEGPVCEFGALPESSRAPQLADFAAIRQRPPSPDETCRWVAAEDALTGRPLFLPFDLVSLDLTRALPSAFERTSNGIAAGASRDEAIVAALHEFIERDAVAEWARGGLAACMASTLDLDRIPYPWLGLWRDRIGREGVALRFHHVPTLTGTPVFTCELNDFDKEGCVYRSNQGRGAHPVPEVALFKALAEALQARLTVVAGARDDLFSHHYSWRTRGARVAFGLPLPPGSRGIDWQGIPHGPADRAALAEALAGAGYGRIGTVELGQAHGLVAVRVFVCGLGSMHRTRRGPAR